MKSFILAALLVSSVSVFADPFPGHHHPGHEHHHFYTFHCTAYAEGHGHDPRYSASAEASGHFAAVVEQRARYQAMMRCEHRTGHHCHDIHCHQH